VVQDEKRDLALLRVKAASVADLKPLRLAAKKLVGRGDQVATLGYPLSAQLGKGLKLVSGTVSGVSEPGTDGMILLDLRVNPGNSGGPLFDTAANVVGLVTAKSLTGRATDSYGLARPAADLESFLREHVPAYQSPAQGERQLEWNQVDRQVSPSVLRVLRRL
jgi:S1-C subfamily serine protease